MILFLSGCDNKSFKNSNDIPKLTEAIMEGKAHDESIEEILTDDLSSEIKIIENIPENKQDLLENNAPNYASSAIQEDIDKVKDNSLEKEKINQEDDAIDTSSIDYKIHKGRIDCLDIDKCIELSLPIQFKYKELIDSVFYLEVKTKTNNSLGYFIDYTFKIHTYSDYDECMDVGTSLQELLPNRIKEINCTWEGDLTIYTDREVMDE